jgi:hypothetical protein
MTPWIVLAALITASVQPAANPDAATQRAVAEVERRFEQALERRDRAALEDVDSRSVFINNAARGMGLSRQRNGSTTFDRTVAVHGDTAVVTSRVRTRSADGDRETWFRQSRLYIRSATGWKMAMGQGTRMYDGPVTTSPLYARYPGVYLLQDGRRLQMEWDGDSLIATLPNGAQSQVFLKSPTEEAIATPEHFLFVLDASGHPTAVRLMRGDTELWRADRKR